MEGDARPVAWDPRKPEVKGIEDTSAFDELFIRALPTLRKQLLRQLGDPYEAEETIQDVYIRFSSESTRERCVAHPNPMGYLIVVAGNIARDSWRRQQRLRKALSLVAAIDKPAHDDGGISEREGLLFVASALRSMTRKEAEAIWLVDVQGHTLMEAGATLGVHWGTVHRHRKRGLDRLRKKLTESAHDDRSQKPGAPDVKPDDSTARRKGKT